MPMLTAILTDSLAFLQPSPIRVVFIGNSVTYANDRPGMMAALGHCGRCGLDARG